MPAPCSPSYPMHEPARRPRVLVLLQLERNLPPRRHIEREYPIFVLGQKLRHRLPLVPETKLEVERLRRVNEIDDVSRLDRLRPVSTRHTAALIVRCAMRPRRIDEAPMCLVHPHE